MEQPWNRPFGTDSEPDGEANLLTTSRDSDHRKSRSPFSVALGVFFTGLTVLTPSITETAIANGDTRTIYLHHAHTGEDIAATYLVNGQYDSRVLQQLNWFLRDWRRDEPTNMDPRLFDVVWEAYRSAGAGDQVINVVSAYRSPETNAMLRARSRAVAKYSQHMLGKAMDTTMPGMPMSHVREVGMRMQRGGVGYYPTANTPFVHLDVGSVRAWPRMTYDQLARLFPDGKTVHLPTNGQPLARYEEAKAEIEARADGAYVVAPRRTGFGGFLASLFGGGGGEDEDAEVAAPPPSTRKQWASLAPRKGRGGEAEVSSESDEGGAAPEPTSRRSRSQIARAEADLPRGETTMSATGAVAVAPPAARRAPLTAAPPVQDGEPAPEAAAQEEKRPRLAHVPLPPPGRPASLDKPTPLDIEKPAEVASAEAGGAQELRSSTEPSEEPATEPAARHFVKAPTPPRRPAGLVAARAAEPAEPASPDDKDNAPLAYSAADRSSAETKDATGEKPEAHTVAQKGEFVPARLDRSNFNALTAATPASRASAKSMMGAPIGAVRSAARASEPSVLLPPARPAHLVGFATTDSPPTDKFAHGASRPRTAPPKTDPADKK